ncbi:MAG: SRPBCC domain-containing protein [Sphingomonadaceae bacterium]|nr:SRPBCC domain-containing protein [Sphingomonadaceae bacterium]
MSEPLELSVTRYIDAPREQAWRAWIDRLTDWWAPKPWTTEIVEHDMRPGGRSALVMRGPDANGNASESAMEGVFLEVDPARRVVFTNAFKAGWIPQDPFMIGLFGFADEGSGTRYTAAARHWTEEAYRQHLAMGFDQGWNVVADQFKAIAEGLA